jgi:hypothetical protein
LQCRIAARERQLGQLPESERGERLLEIAAREIAALEEEMEVGKQRHVEICQRISREEIALRKLLGETREHRREIRLLESQVRRQRAGGPAGQTISGRLAALRETRAAIAGTVECNDHLEAGMEEALDRVTSSPLERELQARQQDGGALRVQAVLNRLRGLAAES